MLAEADRRRAVEYMELFDLIRVAVNGDESTAAEFYDELRTRAGIEKPEPQRIVISSPEEFRRLTGRA